MEKDSLGVNLRRILEEESEKKGPGGALRLPPDSPGETSKDPLDPPRIPWEPPGGLSGLRGKVC